MCTPVPVALPPFSGRKSRQRHTTWSPFGERPPRSVITRCIVGTYRRLAPARVRQSCRFEPSCSEYCLLAVHKRGFWIGWRMTLIRLGRCRPPNGGLDYP
ncbi:membrane protein insertion efficiency factor YidD [Achromobacter aloeverae]